jgi:hypothetical protein
MNANDTTAKVLVSEQTTTVGFGEPTMLLAKIKSGIKEITKPNMNAILAKLADEGKIRKMENNNNFKKNLKYYAQKTEDPTTLYQVLCKNSIWHDDENEWCFEEDRQNFTKNIMATKDMNKPITVWEIKNIVGGRKSRKQRKQRKSRKTRR